MVIWADADACPKGAKELIARASARLQLPVRLVDNRPLAAPPSPLLAKLVRSAIEVVQVQAASDVADTYIVQHVAVGDLVVTADIPLASLFVARGATALDTRGVVHTTDSIGERLAVRNLRSYAGPGWRPAAPRPTARPTGSASPRPSTGCSAAAGRPRRPLEGRSIPMSADSHRALVRRYIDEVWNGRRPAVPFFATGYRRYLAAAAPPLTGADQQQRIRDFQAAFPDLHFTVEDLVAEGDRVVFRATMRGTHQGSFRDIAPTGRPITVTVLDIVRIEDGAFAEQWGGPDLLDLLLQLGAVVSVR